MTISQRHIPDSMFQSRIYTNPKDCTKQKKVGSEKVVQHKKVNMFYHKTVF